MLTKPHARSPQPQWLGITRDLWLTAFLVVTSVLCGGVIILLHEPDIVRRATVLLWALACLAVGTLLGLIFGVPRAATETHSGQPGPANTLGDNSHLRANTNMEQISDWLTKLLVGAGLVELKSMPHHLHTAANYVAEGMGTPGSSSFAAALIIYFFVEGFLGGYLGTRMFFQNAFQRSDATLVPNEALGPRLE